MRQIMLFLIRAYQLCLSPLLGKCCRFQPTCSRYATECYQKTTFWKASVMLIKRLGKCHPWHEGGFDPVCL